jgi:hypothetical protein
VIERLAQLYVKKESWDDAVNFYNILYDYLLFLTNTLEEDQKVINKFIEDRENADKENYPEYEHLTSDELHLLKERTISDYRILTNKLISNSENIRSIQKQNTNYIIELIHTHNKLLTHDLSRHIKGIEHEVENIVNKTRSGEPVELKNVQAQINMTRENVKDYEKFAVHKIVSPKLIDISKEIWNYKLLSGDRYGTGVKIDYQFVTSAKGTFLEFLTTRMLDNLIGNAVEVGARNGKEEISISIRLLKQSDFLYLYISDNCGDLEFFHDVVQCLNDELPVKSKKNNNQIGSGLDYLKQLLKPFNNRSKWELSYEENNTKTLKIPLIKYAD